ncbi:MAG: hypothetical protein M1823_004447 [Watsoniomyces obsoletus]|nr:MAG: hypothetical protein M1823_004447 [Watsoniomyces obsoletus]
MDRSTHVDEDEHVHRVYEQIADHFSATRYKPWPLVENFLKGLPSGSVGLDVGCGNGKYLDVNPDICIIGSDRSPSLVRIAYERGQHGTLVADGLMLPHPAARFDFFISIAVIHHFSTRERRVAAIQELLEMLKPPESGLEDSGEPAAQGLIYVWALEQKTSRRGWDINNPQDVMVPWVTQTRPGPRTKRPPAGSSSDGHQQRQPSPKHSVPAGTPEEKTVTLQRYYHLYRAGELQDDIVAAGGVVLASGYEKDNWWATAQRA